MSIPDVTLTQSPAPIACDPTAIPAHNLARAARLVFHDHQERHELRDGYVWRFTAEQYDEVAAYVANERRCCPFFTFTLEVTPSGGPLWLRVTGDASVKAYLRSALVTYNDLSA